MPLMRELRSLPQTVASGLRGNRQIANLVANFGSSGALVALPLIFNVMYFRILGSAGFGLIGFYAAIAAFASRLDMGLGKTTVREFARRAPERDAAPDLRDILFTMQMVYVAIGVALGAMILASARGLTGLWFRGSDLSRQELFSTVLIMGGMLALTFPTSVFYAVLSGLQRQVLSSSLTVAVSAARGGCALGSLYLFGATPVVFFFAQLVMSVVETATLGVVSWRFLPQSSTPLRFRIGFLRSVWRFSLAYGLDVLIGQFMMMGDKIILSALLPLQMFGLYAFAASLAASVQKLIGPFTTAYFPHFVELSKNGNRALLSHTYHFVSQIGSALLLSAGILLAVYAYPILLLLTGNPAIAATMAPLTMILVCAYTLNALMWLPHTLQTAHGVASIGLRINIVQCAVYLPLVLILTPRYGIYVPAVLWLLINIVAFGFCIALTHRVALEGETWNWLKGSILLPGIGAAIVVALGTFAAPARTAWLVTVPMLVANGVVALIVAMACAPKINEILVKYLKRERQVANP